MAEERRKDARDAKTEKVVKEEKPEVKSGKGRSWKTMIREEAQDILILGLLIPSLRKLGQTILGHFSNKAEKVVKEVLGVEESGKGLGDEIGFTNAVNYLDDAEAIKIKNFEAFLAKNYVDRGQDRLVAFHVFVASGVKDRDVTWGKAFLRELLLNATDDEKFNFLQNRGVFSTMKPEKKPAQTPEFLKSACETVTGAAKVIAEDQAANLEDLETRSESFLEKSKRFRESKGR